MHIQLTGSVELRADGRAVDERRMGRQGRLLFAYLATSEGRPVPREEIAEILWPDGPPAQWERSLAAVVSKLRACMADAGVTGLIDHIYGCYQMTLPDDADVDVLRADRALAEAETHRAAGRAEEAAGACREAIAVAERPLLPGVAGEWAEQRRASLRSLLARALDMLASGEPPDADAAERLITLDPYRESGYRSLMRALASGGDRAGALRVYERCSALLGEELGVTPSPQTEAVYLSILRDEPAAFAGEAWLEVGASAGEHTRVGLAGDRVTLGGAPQNTIRLTHDTKASRMHAMLERFPAGWCIRDLGSTNGTFVNGRRITADVALRDGDTIGAGRTRMVYRSPASAQRPTEIEHEPPHLSPDERAILAILCEPILAGDVMSPPPPLGEVARRAARSVTAIGSIVEALYDRFALAGTERTPAMLASVAVQMRAVRPDDE